MGRSSKESLGGADERAQAAYLPADSLRAELPRMLEEHKAIRTTTDRLGDAARAQGNRAVAQLVERLGEEEVLYPAAVLVGDLVRSRPRGGTAP